MSAEQPRSTPEGVRRDTLQTELTEHLLPLDSIQDEPDIYLDPTRQADMLASIQSNGQTDPIQLARVAGYDRLIVVDGLYRMSALHYQRTINPEADQVSAVIRDMAPEQVIDTRIRSTMWHTPAEFGRVIRGMQDAWSLAPWAADVSLRTAVDLSAKLSTGGLEPEKAVAIRRWLASKWGVWGVRPPLAKRSVEAAEGMAPDIIDQTKITHGRAAGSFLTVSHLRAIQANTRDGDYDQQRTIAGVLLDYPLPAGELPRFFEQAQDESTNLADAARQLYELAQNRIRAGQKRSVDSRRQAIEERDRQRQQPLARTALSALGPVLTTVNEQGLAVTSQEGPTRFRRFSSSPVVFEAANYQSPQKVDDIIRIHNVDEINHLSRLRPRKVGQQLNELEITEDNRVIINKGEVVTHGSVQMEMLNTLLVSYLSKPVPSIKDLCEVYGFADQWTNGSFSVRVRHLHEALTRWHYQGLVSYNERTAQGATLLPILIRDRRVFR